MSKNENTLLLEEAAFYIDYFTDTTIGKVLEADVLSNDLSALRGHMVEARKIAHEWEYNPMGSEVAHVQR